MGLAVFLLNLMSTNLLQMPGKQNKVRKQPGTNHPTVMTTPSKNPTPSTPHYPAKTTGSDAAAAARKEANKWTERQRAELFEKGMRIIYGGSCSTAAKVRS